MKTIYLLLQIIMHYYAKYFHLINLKVELNALLVKFANLYIHIILI